MFGTPRLHFVKIALTFLGLQIFYGQQCNPTAMEKCGRFGSFLKCYEREGKSNNIIKAFQICDSRSKKLLRLASGTRKFIQTELRFSIGPGTWAATNSTPMPKYGLESLNCTVYRSNIYRKVPCSGRRDYTVICYRERLYDPGRGLVFGTRPTSFVTTTEDPSDIKKTTRENYFILCVDIIVIFIMCASCYNPKSSKDPETAPQQQNHNLDDSSYQDGISVLQPNNSITRDRQTNEETNYEHQQQATDLPPCDNVVMQQNHIDSGISAPQLNDGVTVNRQTNEQSQSPIENPPPAYDAVMQQNGGLDEHGFQYHHDGILASQLNDGTAVSEQTNEESQSPTENPPPAYDAVMQQNGGLDEHGFQYHHDGILASQMNDGTAVSEQTNEQSQSPIENPPPAYDAVMQQNGGLEHGFWHHHNGILVSPLNGGTAVSEQTNEQLNYAHQQEATDLPPAYDVVMQKNDGGANDGIEKQITRL